MWENDTLKSIDERRSVRAYADRPATEEQLKTILRAGLQAPSARNSQPWHVICCTDAALLKKMGEEFLVCARKIPGWGDRFADDYSVYHNAPAVIFVCGDKAMEFNGFDSGLLTQNLALAAQSIGLGTVIVAQWGALLNDPYGEPYRKQLGVPDNFRVWVGLSVGYPAEAPDAKPRDAEKFTGDVRP